MKIWFWFHFSLLRQMQSAMLSWANSAGIQSFMDSPGCLAYQDSWVGFIPPNPNQPTNQPTNSWWKNVTNLVVTLETWVGLGVLGGVGGFSPPGIFGAKILVHPWGPPKQKRRRQRSCRLLRWKKPLQKNEETHIPPKSGKFGKLSTQKCGG